MKRWELSGSLVASIAMVAVACDTSGGGGPEADSDSTPGAADDDDDDGPPNGGDPTSAGDGGADATGTGSGEPADDDDDSGPEDDGNANCCVAHVSAGCNEPAAEECVCETDAACCVFGWDANCAALADARCRSTCLDGPRGEGGVACEQVAFQLTPGQDAEFTGDWGTTQSQVGEGTVAFIDQSGSLGAVTYRPEIPCDDTWYVWVRYFDTGDADSYFVTVDGEPSPEAAIFEGDCSPAGDGYGWRLLNWRDAGDPVCTYLQDPWSFEWTAGVHELQFSLLESRAMGRVIITNTLEFDPRR